ncbi:MAG: SoxR reducing system RseC family protein [Pseudomonadota bacterium]
MDSDALQAVVTAVRGHDVHVTRAATQCDACERGTGCGAALLRQRTATNTIVWEDAQSLPQVGAALAPRHPRALLHAAAAGYGLPLAGFIVGALVSETVVPNADAAALSGAVIGMVCGLVSARRLLAGRRAQWRVVGGVTS